MKKFLITLAVIALIALSVCIVLFGSGYIAYFDPDISPAHVASICVTDGIASGETIVITDMETIGLITGTVNGLSPTVGISSSSRNGWLYSVTFLDASGNEIFQVTVVDDNEITCEEHIYRANPAALISCLKRLFP